MKLSKTVVGAALLAFSVLASAQSYPAKPVQMIVAFTPGSAVDIEQRRAHYGLAELHASS